MYGLGLLLGVISALLFYRYAKSGDPVEQEMGCGQCGYNIYKAPTHNCPECGADLRRVGIVPKAGFSPMDSRELRAYALLSGFGSLVFTVAQACLDWLI